MAEPEPLQSSAVQDTEDSVSESLQELLDNIDSAVQSLLGERKRLNSLALQVQKAARAGDLRTLMKHATSSGPPIAQACQALQRLQILMQPKLQGIVARPEFVKEVAQHANSLGVHVEISGNTLLAYPDRVTINAADLSATIGAKKVTSLRPSILATQMRAAADAPVRLKTEAFIEVLLRAYFKTIPRDVAPDFGFVVALLDLYETLTPITGQAKDYPLEAFVRDIYILDESGTKSTKSGYRISLPASTGAKNRARSLSMIGKDGMERVYYGIAFSPLTNNEF